MKFCILREVEERERGEDREDRVKGESGTERISNWNGGVRGSKECRENIDMGSAGGGGIRG
jgi:hypothetical protein